jgi:NADH:ubiquinone oxidoreductase subunit C
MENLVEINKEDLLAYTQDKVYNNYRFVTITCADNGNGTNDLIYHFDKNLELISAKVIVESGEEVQSISKIYFGAILVENEVKELFGINIKDIEIDFGGHMLLSDDDLKNPMSKQIRIIKKGEE